MILVRVAVVRSISSVAERKTDFRILIGLPEKNISENPFFSGFDSVLLFMVTMREIGLLPAAVSGEAAAGHLIIINFY